MSEYKKTCGNCAGRVESIIYKDRCDITEEVIEDLSATCDDWEPNNEVLREMQDDELKALRKERDAALAQVAVLRGALFRVRDEINNYGSQANLAWLLESAKEALSATPAEAAERVQKVVDALERISAQRMDLGGEIIPTEEAVWAMSALAQWRRQT
ncbi:hypothetical protein [uncultured Anaeromusa sp.]|uniref:hypothetical protein n=1 Tax=uncultured Anaeromusa sp. TaxID=673273 RepID=UPI0029C93787|nr:hypothetical protein [uncultured Anaeromusa sp.]